MSQALDISSPTSNAAGPMSRRAMLTLSTTLGLSGLYAAYARLVNPLINPPGLEFETAAAAPPIGPPPRQSQHMAERFLASAPWAANAKYQMRTKEAFVYFEEWKRTENLQAVQFWPFAMIWMHNEHALRDGPITIVSEQARVRFATQFEITNDPGRVIASSLEGRATIRGPNGLKVDGHDFSYSESAARIWSNEPLTFAYGPNSGSAVGVQVDLLLAEKPSDHSLAVSGMRSIRLQENVRMDLVSEPGDKSPIGGGPLAGKKKSTEPTRAKVTSAGPFEYDVTQLVASYEKHVHVETPNDEGQLDTLEAEQLVLTFMPNPEKTKTAEPTVETAATTNPAPPTDETGRFQTFETDLVFRKVHAEGPEVRLRSGERDVTALMTQLDYDATTRIVRMEDTEQVRVLNAGSELRSPAITLVHAEEGSHLQSVWCRGSGWMKHTDPATGRVDLEASWEKQMKIQPDVESGLELLELEQQALVRQPEENSSMRAEFIRLWFDRSDPPENAAPVDRGVASAGPNESDQQRLARNLEPRKLLAIDRVRMESRDLEANTKRLEVWFEQPVVAAVPPAGRAAPTLVPAPRGPVLPQAPGRLPGPQRGTERNAPEDHPLRTSAGTKRPMSSALSECGPAESTRSEAHAIASHVVDPGSGSDSFRGQARSAREVLRTDRCPTPLALRSRDAQSMEDSGSHSESPDDIGAVGQYLFSAPDRMASETALVRVEPPAEKPPTDGPLIVDADLIRVRAVRRKDAPSAATTPTRPASATGRAAKDLEVREVWTFGNVHVRQTHFDGKPPLEVTGQRLHVVNHGPNREVLHVYGSDPAPADENAPAAPSVTVPAHVRDRGMHIEGDRIHLDRGGNNAWVDGAGLLQLPIDQTLDGEKLPEPQPLDVAWTERMEFDGLVAKFFGKVVTTTTGKRREQDALVAEEARLRCAEMHVTLTERVSFADARTNGTPSRTSRPASRRTTVDGRPTRREDRPEVATIRCIDGVLVDATATEGTKVVGVRRAKFWQFDLDQRTGETLARGPGFVDLWRRRAERRAGPGAVVRANAGVRSRTSDWEYTHIDFEGVNRGNTLARTSRFEGRVAITHGPVAEPLDEFTVDDLPPGGGHMRSETLDVHSIEKTATQPAYITTVASGNAYLEGREQREGHRFFARADEVTFDESKGRYVVRSKGNRDATVSHEKPTGGYENQSAKRFELVPSRNIFKADRVQGIDGSG